MDAPLETSQERVALSYCAARNRSTSAMSASMSGLACAINSRSAMADEDEENASVKPVRSAAGLMSIPSQRAAADLTGLGHWF